MIEECEDILECENKLSPIIQEISLLGEIPLSVEEVDKLGTFIKEQISDDIRKGTKFLKTETPTCVACFLVWKGILDYRGGDYWSAVKDSVDLSDPNWQGKWGKIFIDFLESNRLPSFDIKGAHHYVTPLLMHGMIPNSYLNEYFEKIIYPMVGKLTDPTDLKEISSLLGTQREDNEAIKTIEEEIEKLQDNKKQISSRLIKYRSLIKIWDDLDEIKTLEREVGDHGELASLPEDPLEYKNKKNSEMQDIQKGIEDLENEERLCEQRRNKFSELDKKILADLEAIDRCINILPGLEHERGELTELNARENLLKKQMEECAQSIFSDRWDERYVPSIRELPFDDLKDKIEAFNSRKVIESSAKQGYFENILKIVKGWTDYFFSRPIKRERTSQEIQVEISKILKDLPIDERVIECPQLELVHNLKQLYDNHETISHLRESRSSIEQKTDEQISRIKSVAEGVGVDIADDIQSMVAAMQHKLADARRNKQTADQAEHRINEIKNDIRESTAEKDALFKELHEIDERLANLGNGDVHFGVEQLKQRRDAQFKAESIRNDLKREYPDLGSLEREKDEVQRNGTDESYYISEIDRFDVEIRQIKQRITELEEKLKQIQIPFSPVEEPTRRFLLYGDDAASDFLVRSVQMMYQTEKEKNVPSADGIGLPERVVTRFEEWWKRQPPQISEIISSEPRKSDKRGEVEQQKDGKTNGTKQPEPINIPGRRRDPTGHPKIVQPLVTKSPPPKPELVCWNEEWNWVIGIEVPEELKIISVAQNEELLEHDDTDESRYRLKHVEGKVKVTWTEGEKDISLAGPGRNYLIFKMRENWKDPGRLIRYSTAGYYLVIVPQEWERDEEVTGPASVAPESVQLAGYNAHFFYQERKSDTAIGFIAPDGERIQVESGGARFQLIGREIDDASEYMGPLFGEQPPPIQTLDEKGWSDVGVIVVGEEGSGRNKWRMQFDPQVGVKEQKLPEEIANRRGGWYFVRIYDNDYNLLESMDFRFMIALEDICIKSSGCLPGPNGYENVTVKFLHRADCKVELMDENMQSIKEIHRERYQTTATVPPTADRDKTQWILRDGDAEIKVTVLVERVWWAFGVIGADPIDWVDKPIILSREDFAPTSNKALFVRLPRPRFVRKIDVGFDRAKSRPYQVEVKEEGITIPLRDFGDSKEIEKRQEESMVIGVQPEGAEPDETVVVKIPADPLPPDQIPHVLQAIVKSRRGQRKSKGFSRNEIISAGITMWDMKRLHISCDRRRKTSYSWNIKNLKTYNER